MIIKHAVTTACAPLLVPQMTPPLPLTLVRLKESPVEIIIIIVIIILVNLFVSTEVCLTDLAWDYPGV